MRFFKELASGAVCLLAAIMCFAATDADAVTIRYGSNQQTVRIVYGKPTIFRFDEPVKTLSNASKFEISPADESTPDYSVLKVRPRYRKSRSEINFILANGAVVRVLVSTSVKPIPEKTHSFYDFVPKDTSLTAESSQVGSIGEMNLLKAMIRGDQVAGYRTRRLTRSVLSGHPELEIKLVKLYTGPKYNGYVFQVTNISKENEYELDLEKLKIGRPNTALLSQADLKILRIHPNKENSSLLRVVASASATYYNINLPFKELAAK